MSELKPCPCCGNEDIETYFMDLLGEGDYVNHAICHKCGASAPVAIWNARATDSQLTTITKQRDKLENKITNQEKVIGELYKQLDHCHSWLKIHADYHGSPLCINTDKILAKHKQTKGE